jgi:solute carrier family 7 (L-type amino acid transporter), member 9/15
MEVLHHANAFKQANFVAGEMRNPSRDLPLAIHTAMAVVICCFELTNVSYYIILPWKDLSMSDAVAVVCSVPHLRAIVESYEKD